MNQIQPIASLSVLLLLGVLLDSQAKAGENDRMLFSFQEQNASRQWRTVNDGVMGGRSDGRFRINDDQRLEFYGTLSLRNNGGFASVRAMSGNLGLKTGDEILMRVRGDGRTYSLNLYPPGRRTAFSYRVSFPTTAGEWTELRIPVEDFTATSFGRTVRNARLDPSSVSGIGILLGDKKPGSFKLEVEWIKVNSTAN